jgi:hypothetical protein
MLANGTELENYRRLLQDGHGRGDRPVRLLGLGVKLIPITQSDASTPTDDDEVSLPAPAAPQLSLGLE